MEMISRFRDSVIVKMVILGLMMLILFIPLLMVEGVIQERLNRRNTAVSEVQEKWGREQSLTGPVLVVPFKETYLDDKNVAKVRIRNSFFLPDSIHVSSNLTTEKRYRGMFEIVLYKTDLDIKGSFSMTDFSEQKIGMNDYQWKDAYLVIGIPDTRGIAKEVALQWGGKSYAFRPGPKDNTLFTSGIHAPLADLTQFIGKKTSFTMKLVVRGSDSLHFIPIGKESVVKVKSSWPDPSFSGNFLPTSHKINSEGFEANWDISFFGRNFPQFWKQGNTNIDRYFNDSRFGFKLFVSVDQYQKSIRAIKYAMLFIFLTFLAVFLMEILSHINIHPIQYLLVGFAMSFFYLLLLAISEHSSFLFAYLVASVSVIALITWYSKVILKTMARGTISGFSVLVLYVYLYILLVNQDYSLLIGSIGLFLVLFAVMFITRSVDWSRMGWSNDKKS